MMETHPIHTSITHEYPFVIPHTGIRHYHRIAEVRKSQNLSIACAAKRLGVDVSEVRRQENPETDLSLSQLYRWQEILEVPLEEILPEQDEMFESPIQIRAKLVRVMKTVRSIMEQSQENVIQHLTQTLFDQLVEIMPELKEVTSWPSIGQAREFKDYGQAIYRRFDPGIERNLLE